MGLFDFIKDAGARVAGKGREAEEVKELLTKELGDRIENMAVEFDEGVITLSGSCDSQATKEKAILLAGNIRGVEKVNDEGLTAVEPVEASEFYTVQPGDSLSKIAKHYYGDAMKYPEIFKANQEVIKDPNLIYPGQKLLIPKID